MQAQTEYRVVVSGKILEDRDREAVINDLSKIFKCTGDKASRLIAGKPTRLKKEMTKEMADRYCSLLRKAGVICNIEPLRAANNAELSLEQVDTPSSGSAALSLEQPVEEPVKPTSLEGASIALEPISKAPEAPTESRPGTHAQQSSVAIAPDADIDEVDELELFVGDAFDEKYRLKFAEIRNNGDKLTFGWSWAAFFIPMPWMIYRKMYIMAAIYFILAVIAPPLLSIVLNIVAATCGVYLYYRFAQSRIAAITATGIERRQEIAAKGNVMSVPAVIGIMLGISALFWGVLMSYYAPQEIAALEQEMNSDISNMHSSVDEASALQIVVLKQAINLQITLQKAANNGDFPLPANSAELRKKLGLPREMLVDSWGNDIEYKPTGTGYTLHSPGPDRRRDTEDDVIVKSVLK